MIKNIFCSADSRPLRIELFNPQRQIANSNNCGLFAVAVAVAVATAILNGQDPSTLVFKEEEMRLHLCECFEKQSLTMFPCM